MMESTCDFPVSVNRVSRARANAPATTAEFRLSNIPTWARLWWVTLVVFTLFVDLSRPTGWLGSDDAAYHAAAEHLLTGTPIERAHHHYARMAMVLPVAVSMRLFGDNTWAVALPSMLAAIGCVTVVALIGAATWGWWEGLCAATLLAVIPYFRVLSTTAFPDVHACFWSAVAVLAAIRSRECHTRSGAASAVLAGLAAAIALSAKVTCAAVVPVVFAIVCLERPIRGGSHPDRVWHRLPAGANTGKMPVPHRLPRENRKTARICALSVAGGMLVAFLVEGWFHAVVAGDFWFSLHSLTNTQGAVDVFASSELRRSPGILSFVIDRLTLPLRPADSGWGILGGAFWPVLIGSLWIDARARALAAWGLLAYLTVAFMPVSSADGLQPMPIFHGRHVLTAIVPFTLCLGHLTHRVISATARKWNRPSQPWVVSTWPGVVIAASCVFAVTRRDLNGFQDRDTRRIGLGIRELVEAGTLEGRGEIVITPSMYWRFRVLFPPAMRDRLRVDVAPDAPSWWRQTVPGIASRLCSVPLSHGATLLATPLQLRGEAESWDYGCPLPAAELNEWRSGELLALIVRAADGHVALGSGSGSVPNDAIVVAVGIPNVP